MTIGGRSVRTLSCAFFLIGTATTQARATVIPSIACRNTVVPSNGVLVCDEDVTSVVVRRGGAIIPGTLEAKYGHKIFRPTTPFVLGAYTAEPTVPEGTFGFAETREFEVVAAANVPPGLLDVTFSFSVLAGVPSAAACCSEAADLADLKPPCAYATDPCDYQPREPLCSPSRYYENQTMHVNATLVGTTHVIEEQVLARFIELPETGMPQPSPLPDRISSLGNDNPEYSRQPYRALVDYDPSEDEYCATLEVVHLTDDSVETVKSCAANPHLQLGEVDSTPDLSIIERCHLPPTGYEQLWCDQNFGQCVTEPGRLSGDDYEFQVATCTHYYEICKQQPLAAGTIVIEWEDPYASQSPDTPPSPDPGPQPTPSVDQGETDELPPSETTWGCHAATLPLNGMMAPAWLLLGAVTTALGFMRRQRRAP